MAVVKVEPGEVLRHQSHLLLAQLVIKLYLNIPDRIPTGTHLL